MPFVLTPATRVWNGRSIATPADLAAGQSVQLNLTVCTLKGPGRCTDVWIDPESREVAAAQQLEVHRLYQREHGLAGWVDAVDNREGTVAVTLFAGVDPALVEEFTPKGSLAAAVAEASLRTYDQINDAVRGPILDVSRHEPAGARRLRRAPHLQARDPAGRATAPGASSASSPQDGRWTTCPRRSGSTSSWSVLYHRARSHAEAVVYDGPGLPRRGDPPRGPEPISHPARRVAPSSAWRGTRSACARG